MRPDPSRDSHRAWFFTRFQQAFSKVAGYPKEIAREVFDAFYDPSSASLLTHGPENVILGGALAHHGMLAFIDLPRELRADKKWANKLLEEALGPAFYDEQRTRALFKQPQWLHDQRYVGYVRVPIILQRK